MSGAMSRRDATRLREEERVASMALPLFVSKGRVGSLERATTYSTPMSRIAGNAPAVPLRRIPSLRTDV